MSLMYVNEMNLIEAISKSWLIDWKPHIKKHQVMAGMINLKFYKKAKEFYEKSIEYYKNIQR